MLNETDFYRLKSQCAAFSLAERYEDWLDEREGLLIGLSAAGVQAIRIEVKLEKLLVWCARRSAAPDESALDRFAASIQGTAMTRSNFVPLLKRAAGLTHPRFERLN